MPDVFLSYSRDDQHTARRFAEALQGEGFSVWWDQKLRSGEAYDQVTETALKEAKAVVVLWSKQSVDSRWVRTEATIAHRNRTLVPVTIEACERPIMFELTQTADLSHWKGDAGDKAWLTLVNDIRQLIGKQPVTDGVARGGPRRRRITAPMLAIPVAIAAVAGTLSWWLNSSKDEAPAPVVAGTPHTVPEATLAVLPFADMSPAHDHEYFSDGLTEELLNQLARVKGLRVTARTSSFSFKGRNEDMRVIGEKLGVGNILEGSVRKDGNQLRITAQLINARDGTHLWSQTYDRELKGIFTLQEDVAKDVAAALSITLDVGSLPRVQGGTTNVEAYDKYLQAWKLGLQDGRTPKLQAARLLREAVALDPGFSRGWLSLATVLPETLIGVPQSDSAAVRAEAQAAMEKTLELAPDAWWSQLLPAQQLLAERKWAQGEAAVTAAWTAAVKAGAENETLAVRGIVAGSFGRVRELNEILEALFQINPLSLGVSSERQIYFAAAGQPALAQKEYERSKALDGTHQRSNIFALMRVLSRRDAGPSDIDAGFRTILEDESLPMSLTHALAGKFRNPAQVRAAISQAIDDPENQDRVRMTVVALYADGFDQKDLALAALRRAVIDLHFDYALWYPFKSALRADPRFKDILREVGLVDYFRTSGKWGDFCRPVGNEDFECH